jgi:hypothetical protein
LLLDQQPGISSPFFLLQVLSLASRGGEFPGRLVRKSENMYAAMHTLTFTHAHTLTRTLKFSQLPKLMFAHSHTGTNVLILPHSYTLARPLPCTLTHNQANWTEHKSCSDRLASYLKSPTNSPVPPTPLLPILLKHGPSLA